MQLPLDIPFFGGICSAPVEPTDLLDAVDIVFSEEGAAHARGDLADFAGGISGLPLAFFNAEFKKYGAQLLLQTTTGVYKFTAPNTWTLVATGLGSTLTGGSICQLDQMVYLASPDYTALARYNGAGFAHANGSPKCSIVVADQNYVYAASGNEIWYAESGADFNENAKFRTSNGDDVIDLCHLYGSLIIFKRSGIDIKRGLYEEDFTIEPISNTGCYSRICQTPLGIFFMGITSLMRFDGSNCKVATTKLDSTVFSSNSGDIVIMFYSSEYHHLYIPCQNDSYLWCYQLLKDRWSRFSVQNVTAIGNTGSFEASGTQNSFWLTYSGSGTARLTISGSLVSATIDGVPDANFTVGTTEGTIDLGDPSVDTLGGLKSFINALTDYTCDFLSPYDATTASDGFSSMSAVALSSSRTYCTFAGGVITPKILIGDNSGTVKQGWEDTKVPGSIKTAILDFGSNELMKRPKYLMVNGLATAINVYSDVDRLESPYNYREHMTATLEKNISPHRVDNILPFPGKPRHNFLLDFQYVHYLYGIKFVVEGVTWRGLV